MPKPNRFERRQRRIKVLANPWLVIDSKGRPCGAVPCDPNEHDRVGRSYVGARVDRQQTKLVPDRFGQAAQAGEARFARQDTVWAFLTEPVELPYTHYYADKVRKGQLFAADEKSAVACGIAAKNFQEPGKLLDEAKAAAIADFVAHYGEGAFESAAAMRKDDGFGETRFAKDWEDLKAQQKKADADAKKKLEQDRAATVEKAQARAEQKDDGAAAKPQPSKPKAEKGGN